MSRSKRLPIYKDKGIDNHSSLRKKIRRRIKQMVKDIKNLSDRESYELPNPKILVNDYDWSDYTSDFRFVKHSSWRATQDWFRKYFEENQVKYSRK